MIITIIFIIGFLIGSFPTAYILLKKLKNIDITKNGSKNVGALNSFQVSSSKLIGLTVLLIDLLKGASSVLIARYFFPDSFLIVCSTLVLAVLGHCYSPWIHFKGGKGLATAAGGALFLAPSILVLWIIFWSANYIYRKKVIFSNVAATILTLFITISSAEIMSKSRWFTNPEAINIYEFILPVASLLLVILTKHVEFFKEYVSEWSRRNRHDS